MREGPTLPTLRPWCYLAGDDGKGPSHSDGGGVRCGNPRVPKPWFPSGGRESLWTTRETYASRNGSRTRHARGKMNSGGRTDLLRSHGQGQGLSEEPNRPPELPILATVKVERRHRRNHIRFHADTFQPHAPASGNLEDCHAQG